MPRVLVVDDQADVRTIISIVLRIHHFEIIEAESAASALKLFEEASFGEASFDLAIVDIGLPKLDGYEVARRVRQQIPASELRLVALTGYGQDSDHELVMRAGFDTHLVKPLNHARLEKILAGF